MSSSIIGVRADLHDFRHRADSPNEQRKQIACVCSLSVKRQKSRDPLAFTPHVVMTSPSPPSPPRCGDACRIASTIAQQNRRSTTLVYNAPSQRAIAAFDAAQFYNEARFRCKIFAPNEQTRARARSCAICLDKQKIVGEQQKNKKDFFF